MRMTIETEHWLDVLAVVEGMLCGIAAMEGVVLNHQTEMMRGAQSLVYKAVEHLFSLAEDEEREPMESAEAQAA